MTLEICCGSLTAVQAAVRGGADRVELCSGLADGGLTPSVGLIKLTKPLPVKVNVLIRPRPGDFVYSRQERTQMDTDLREAIRAGADGLVLGALLEDGTLDMDLLDEQVVRARRLRPGCSLTLHRCFDLTADPLKALEQARLIGFDRVLTSGCAPTAEKGLEMLARLRERGRELGIAIMAGGGVTPDNAARIAACADELHASARKPLESRMTFRRPGVSMGAPGADEYAYPETDPGTVHSIKQAIS